MTTRDLTRDGSSDIIWWNDNGELGYWDFDHGTPSWAALQSVNRSAATLLGVGDVTGDGGQDILWDARDTVIATTFLYYGEITNQRVGYWDMDNSRIESWQLTGDNFSSTYLRSNFPPITEEVRGHLVDIICSDGADFLGDGRSSYITNDQGTYSIRALADPNHAYTTYSISPGSDWSIAGLGDFTKDRTTDILWRNAATDEVALHTVKNGVSISYTALGSVAQNWEVAATDDFNGDGRADILWRDTSTNHYGFWTTFDYGSSVAAAWTELGIFDPDWQVAKTGDYFGDGSADLIWRSTSTGELQLWDYDQGVMTGYVGLGIVTTDWHLV